MGILRRHHWEYRLSHQTNWQRWVCHINWAILIGQVTIINLELSTVLVANNDGLVSMAYDWVAQNIFYLVSHTEIAGWRCFLRQFAFRTMLETPWKWCELTNHVSIVLCWLDWTNQWPLLCIHSKGLLVIYHIAQHFPFLSFLLEISTDLTTIWYFKYPV